MNQNQNKNPRQKKSYLGLILISIILFIGVWVFITQYVNQADELKSQDFWTYLDNKQIESMTIQPAGGNNSDDYYIYGKYIDENGNLVKYEIIYPKVVIDEKVLSPGS